MTTAASTAKLARVLGALCVIALASAAFARSASAFGPFPEQFGNEEYGVFGFSTKPENQDGSLAFQAGSHPFALSTSVIFNHQNTEVTDQVLENLNCVLEEPGCEIVSTEDPKIAANTYGNPKDVEVNFPPGVVINPDASPVKCTEAQLETNLLQGGECPVGSAVGVDIPSVSPFGETLQSAVYNMVPPPGVPAELGVNPGGIGLVFHIFGKVRTGTDDGITGEVPNITQKVNVYGARLILWGEPSAEIHDSDRGVCATAPRVLKEVEREFFEAGWGKLAPSGNRYDCPLAASERTHQQLLTMPGSCSGNQREATLSTESWQQPHAIVAPPQANTTTKFPPVTGCDKLQFHPSLSAVPAPAGVGPEAPSGLDVDLKFPLDESNGLAEANLKKAVVTLPEGIAVSPSAANGLAGCPAEGPGGFNLHATETESEGVKHSPRGHCPDASKLGTVEVLTPLLEKPLTGFLYLAQPTCGGAGQPSCTEASATNGELFGLYIEVEAQGAIVKLAGEVAASPQTGQLTATFDDNPQLPFRELRLSLFTGPRAPLVTPSACGSYAASSQLTPWSGTAPLEALSPSFTVGGSCARPFAPSFTAGTTNSHAGSYSPFSLTVSRQDREQRLSGLTVTLPPGLLARLAGVPLCSGADAGAGTCPAASRLGSVTAAAGPGSNPYYVSGHVYLSGAYNGAPYSLVEEVPALAGPFNLGVVVVRQALHVDPNTGQVTAVSDPLPTILDGVPLDLRTISVTIDRPGFTFNPTSCAAMAVTGTLGSTSGASAAISSPFQATGCASLPFKPSFTASTQGATSRLNGASLSVKISQSAGEANIHKVDLTLPRVLPSRLTTIQKACTAAQFAANPAGCPEGSFIGVATAHTPLLAGPLTGPAILVSHGGVAFPDVEFVLQGEGLRIVLDGAVDIKHGITYSRFETVPDAPISSFETTLPEGPHSALGANGNLCALTRTTTVKKRVTVRVHGHVKHTTRTIKRTVPVALTMPTTITAQNGAQTTQNTPITVTGCPKPSVSAKHAAAGRASSHTRMVRRSNNRVGGR